MRKLYTNPSPLRTLIFLLALIPTFGFASVIGGPDGPGVPDSLLLTPNVGHVECNIHLDTNCVTKTLVLEAWIDWTFTGISEPVTVPWSTGVTAHKIIVTPPGSWSWDVTNIGCESVHQHNFITLDESFFAGPIDIIAPPAICPFEIIELTVNTLGYNSFSSFEWSPENDNLSPYSVSAPGIYSLTVTDAYGCPFTDQVNIPLIPPFVPQIQGPIKICPEGDTATLVVQGPYHNFQWSSGDSGSPLIVNEPGLYEVTATDQYGCTGVGTFGLQSAGIDPFGISMTSANLCPGQLDTLRVLAGFTQYLWSNGATGITNIVNQAGTYTVTVTNNYGCTSTEEVTVQPLFPPPLSITTTPLCPGGSATLTAVGGPFPNYSWSNNQHATSITVTMPGTYSVTISGAGICATNTNVVVPVAPAPTTIIAPPNLLTCAVTQVSLNGSGSSSGPNYPLTWVTQGGHFLLGQNTLTPAVDDPGTYILSITDATTGCITKDTVVVTENVTPPGANAGPPALLTCAVQNLNIGPLPAPIDTNLLPVWSTTNGNIAAGDSTWSPNITLPGIYTLTVTNNINQCTSTANVTITQNTTLPQAQIAPPSQITCTQGIVPLQGTGSSTGPNFAYQWSTTNGTLSGPTNGLNAAAASIGTYTLMVTNTTTGCTSTSSVNVSADVNIPNVAAIPPQILTCNVQNVLIDASASSTGATYQYNWTPSSGGVIVSGGNTLTPTVSAPGTYTLSLLNTANNCSATLGVQVQQDIVPPVASAGPNTTLNCTLSSLQLDGSASSAGSNFTYLWTTTNGVIVNGNTTLNPTIGLAGTYQLLVTNTTNGCTTTSTTQVLNDANAPQALIAPPNILTCSTQQINLNASASTQNGTVNYVWNGPGIVSGQGTLNLGVDQPGTYTLVITNSANGCTDDASIVVTQDIVPPVALAGPDGLINCYTPTGTIGNAANPSGAGYSLSWTTVGGNFITPTNGPTASINQAGTYQLLITNTQNGCTDTDDVIVAADFTPPAAEAGPTFELTCVTTATILQGTGSTGANFQYVWSTTDGNILSGNNTLTPTVNADGTYNLLITNTTNGCTSTDQVLITQSADVPAAAAGLPQTLTCAITSTTLNGAGSSTGSEFTYAWATNTGTISNGGTTLTPTVTDPGTYTVTVTNTTNNCTAVASVLISENVQQPVINAGADNTLTCATTTLPLQAQIVSSSSTGISYAWTTTGGQIINGANTASPTIGAPGTYSVVVTDAINGCTGTDNLVINSNTTPPIAAIASPATLTCVLLETTLNTTGSSTGNNFTYAWTTQGGHIVSVQNPQQPIVDDPGVYNLVITNSINGCTQTASMTVPEDVAHPAAEAGQTVGLDCDTQTNALNGVGSSTGANFAYAWSTTNGQIITGANTLTPTIGDPGSYVLVVTNNSNGCTQTDNVQVTEDVVPPAFAITQPQVLTCAITSVPLNATGNNFGPNPAYTWSTTNGNIVTGGNTLNATVNDPGNYSLTVLNNQNGCSTTVPVQVTENVTPPTVGVQPAPMLTCSVLQFPLQSTPSAQTSMVWNTTNGHIVSGGNTPNPIVDEPGTYSVLVTSLVNGCTTSNTIPVAQETNLPTGVQVDLVHPLCNGTPGHLTVKQVVGGVGPYSYSIDGGQNFFTFEEFGDLGPGQFNLTVQDVNGCEIEHPITIIPPLQPLVTTPPQFSIHLGETQELQAIVPPPFPVSLINEVIWTPVDDLTFAGNSILQQLNPKAAPFKTTEYTVTIVTKEGCKSVARTTIKVDREVDIYAPNVIWPDAQNPNNSVFQLFGRDESIGVIHKLQIFDRWGNMMFENKEFTPNSDSNGWDGTFRGAPVNPAVFVWYAEVELVDGRILLLKGDVTVVR